MIGVDIVEVARIKQAIEKQGQLFLNRIFTQNEQVYCNKFKSKEAQYAGRFAAKEAVAKLIQQGPKDFWLDIEVIKNEHGAPLIQLSDRLARLYPHTIALSISHEKNYAVAVAIKVCQ